MRLLVLLTMVSLTIQSCSSRQKNNNDMGFFDKLFGKKGTAKEPEKTANVDSPDQADINYQSKLVASKQFYPFKNWRKSYDEGLTQYTEDNCNKIKLVFDELINSLIKIGAGASESRKIELFKTAILKTNELNEKIEGLIETGEREDLCELTDKITIACGIDPHKYGAGEGLASEWREW